MHHRNKTGAKGEEPKKGNRNVDKWNILSRFAEDGFVVRAEEGNEKIDEYREIRQEMRENQNGIAVNGFPEFIKMFCAALCHGDSSDVERRGFSRQRTGVLFTPLYLPCVCVNALPIKKGRLA